jgi:hypothetical protein
MVGSVLHSILASNFYCDVVCVGMPVEYSEFKTLCKYVKMSCYDIQAPRRRGGIAPTRS